MNNTKLTKSSIKRVSIIGSLNPVPCYEEGGNTRSASFQMKKPQILLLLLQTAS